MVGAGAGNHPVYVPGKVYLAGPYKGAPLSLAVITPAISGPYDLGNVVVGRRSTSNPGLPTSPPSPTPCPRFWKASPCDFARSSSNSTARLRP